MRTVDISFRMLSDVVWQRVLQSSGAQFHVRREPLFKTLGSLETLRQHADYDTGSISAATAWLLYSAVGFFRPRTIVEVGTFIGKSAIAMAMGADDAEQPCLIHTCDVSNMIDVPSLTQTKIQQYKKTESTGMFQQLGQQNPPPTIDFLHLDGRLRREDFPLLSKLLHAQTVVALDDFEGVEKGVANLMNINDNRLMDNHAVVYPCPDRLLAPYMLNDGTTTALLIPQSIIRLTAQ